jgi:transposase InsO family protein
MESFFSSLKSERTAAKTYRSRDEAKADVFDYIERFYNARRRHSTIGYLSPMEFERRAGSLKSVSSKPGVGQRPDVSRNQELAKFW